MPEPKSYVSSDEVYQTLQKAKAITGLEHDAIIDIAGYNPLSVATAMMSGRCAKRILMAILGVIYSEQLNLREQEDTKIPVAVRTVRKNSFSRY